MDWPYLAGFTDGDGCIGVESPKNSYLAVRLRWSQKESNSVVLDKILEFLRSNGLKVTARAFSVSYSGHKYPQRELSITNTEDTRIALTQLLPYLIIKRERALAALEVLNEIKVLKEKYGNQYRVHLAKEGLTWPSPNSVLASVSAS